MKLKDYTLKATTIRDLVRIQGALGDKPLAILDGETLTYAQADIAANRVANSLIALGVRKGDVVATYLYNSLDHIALWFGCAKIGAIWAPMNIALINVDLAHTINDTGARVLVVDAGLLKNYLPIRDRVVRPDRIEVLRGRPQDGEADGEAGDGWTPFDALLDGAAEEPVCDVHWSDPAGLIFTGGSTGLPKGTLVANAWYFPGIYRYYEMFRPTSDDVHMAIGQMYHTIGSAVDILSPLYFGMTTVLGHWFSASRFWDTVRAHRATISVVIGPALLTLNGQPVRPDDGDNPLRIIGTASGGMPRSVVEAFSARFGVDVLELYGQTETGPLGCFSQRIDDRPYHSLGTANGWADVMIGDRHGQPCAAGVVGEILLRPVYPGSFMLGYFNRPDKYAESCRDLWFHTGDLGHLDERGYLHFDGRVAHVISRRGENIAAVEVESVLLTHPAVRRCAVVGVPSQETGDDEVKAYVEIAADAAFEPLDLIKHCEDRIAYFKVPRYVEVLAQFPLSATKGEIERHKLKALGVNGAWDREAVGYKVRRRA